MFGHEKQHELPPFTSHEATHSVSSRLCPEPLGFLQVNLRHSLSLRNYIRLTPLCYKGSLRNLSCFSVLAILISFKSGQYATVPRLAEHGRGARPFALGWRNRSNKRYCGILTTTMIKKDDCRMISKML